MSKAARSADAGESSTSPTGGSSSASGVPVQVTNVVQIIAEHVPGEYTALLAYIEKLKVQTADADRYKEQLEKIAADAGVTLSPQG